MSYSPFGDGAPENNAPYEGSSSSSSGDNDPWGSVAGEDTPTRVLREDSWDGSSHLSDDFYVSDASQLDDSHHQVHSSVADNISSWTDGKILKFLLIGLVALLVVCIVFYFLSQKSSQPAPSQEVTSSQSASSSDQQDSSSEDSSSSAQGGSLQEVSAPEVSRIYESKALVTDKKVYLDKRTNQYQFVVVLDIVVGSDHRQVEYILPQEIWNTVRAQQELKIKYTGDDSSNFIIVSVK